jgi:HlyD family secretion protein
LVQKDPEEAAGGETAAPSTGGIPEGFEYVQVTLGVNNDEYIEITGGLSEGDTIAYLSTGTGGMMVGMYGAEVPEPSR